MTIQDKLDLLGTIMEATNGKLTENTLVTELEEWDSLVQLSLIVLMKDEFDRVLPAKDIKNIKSVKDILDYME